MLLEMASRTLFAPRVKSISVLSYWSFLAQTQQAYLSNAEIDIHNKVIFQSSKVTFVPESENVLHALSSEFGTCPHFHDLQLPLK